MSFNKEMELSISDAIIERPIYFSIGKFKLCLYPPTLGKMQILKNLYFSMDVNMELLAINPLAETLRVCKEKSDIVCQIVAYSTFDGKKSVMDIEKILHRAKFLEGNVSVEDMATILTIILSNDQIEEFIQYFGIDADREMKTQISRIKGEGNSVTFGGKSIYGLLIDFACQRYGWTMDYVLWGISYVNLNMLFADSITTVYLSDEERKKLGRGDGRVVNADDPKNRDLVRRMIRE
ncbi:hypothetical protein [Bacteroides xylanisolvens]|uniref:hypothetical protein n=1 Tax=Bacteroides xylanisolvens TaxID=371601 RepID=UPI0039B42DD9